MKANTGLLALGLFAIAGVVTVSCGGSSDSTDNPGSAGTTSKAGTTSTAGTSSSTAGSGNNTAGTANNTGGTANSNGGTANNNGGRNNNNGGAPDFPGVGGAGFEVPACPADAMDGEACTRMQGGGNAGCQVNDTTYCTCQGRNDPTWNCFDTGDLPGAGGAGTGFGDATCPANAMTGDTCTGGPGLCAGQTCYCGQDGMTQCL